MDVTAGRRRFFAALAVDQIAVRTSVAEAGADQRCAQTRNERGIWQRRFWEHLIRNEADYVRHVEYCYINPVKHVLVSGVHDWPHSSFHRDVRAGIFPEDWAGDVDAGGEFGER